MLRDSAWDVIQRAFALSVFLDTQPGRERWDGKQPERPEKRLEPPRTSGGERR